jgi:hypothetical protein
MDKKELIKDIEKKFEQLKKELKFNATLEDLDKMFSIKDGILKDEFVSENFARQVCYRIVETYMGWNEYLHSIIMPNPQNILNMSESKIFSQEEKKEIVELMKKIMEINSQNSLMGLTKDKEAEAKFIDNALKFWEMEFKPKIVAIMQKINQEWGKQ